MLISFLTIENNNYIVTLEEWRGHNSHFAFLSMFFYISSKSHAKVLVKKMRKRSSLRKQKEKEDLASLQSWVEQRHRRGVSGVKCDVQVRCQINTIRVLWICSASPYLLFPSKVFGSWFYLCWSCKSRWKKSPHLEEYQYCCSSLPSASKYVVLGAL